MMNYFAHPGFLGLLPLLACVWLVALWGRRQKRRAMRCWASRGGPQNAADCAGRAPLAFAVPAAGPAAAADRQCRAAPGHDHSRESRGGQDIVAVLDVSQSMLAEQPSRLERALRSLHDLADHLQKRGGQRIALVVFAARPRLIFPLTNDYDHFRHAPGKYRGRRPARRGPSARRRSAHLRHAHRGGSALAVNSFDLEGSCRAPWCFSRR